MAGARHLQRLNAWRSPFFSASAWQQVQQGQLKAQTGWWEAGKGQEVWGLQHTQHNRSPSQDQCKRL